MCVCMYMRVSMCECVYVCLYVCVCMCVYMCVYIERDVAQL